MARMRVLHVASEALPLAKSGGLADVVGTLPKALKAHKVDARIVIPAYREAIENAEKIGKITWKREPLHIEAGGIPHRLRVGYIRIEGIYYYMLSCPELYDREGLYGPRPSVDFEDNSRRFSVFCKAALALPQMLGWIPHIIHAHDWQAGLIPVLRERGFCHDLPATRTVFTIHNIAYQGATWHFDIKLAGLDWSLFNPMQLEHHGKLNLLKAGVVFADRVTTVSRRYAEEILTSEFGYGLDSVLQHHRYKLSGIRNGIDTDVWNPETDPLIPKNYSAKSLAGKKVCRKKLREIVGLKEHKRACLVGVVSRLVHQKGLDLVADTVEPYVLDGRMQLVVLGTGDLELEARFRDLENRHPGMIAFHRGYDEELAHGIEAGADVFLMPSRFEPCGLNQMYSLRYGTLPIVRYTGGLADSVSDVLTDHGNGFTFGPADAGHLSSVLDRALGLYEHYPKEWTKAVKRAMNGEYSWESVAGSYDELYRSLVHVA